MSVIAQYNFAKQEALSTGKEYWFVTYHGPDAGERLLEDFRDQADIYFASQGWVLKEDSIHDIVLYVKGEEVGRLISEDLCARIFH